MATLPWKTRLPALATVLALLAAPGAALGATFTVTKTADTNDGTCDVDCSLREAIVAANAVAGPHTIAFNITGGGVRTITLTSPLPSLTQQVTIDGYTQPGSSPNTNATGPINAVPLIEVRGGGFSPVLDLRGPGIVVRGLVINGALTLVQALATSGATVAGNFIGTTADGMGVVSAVQSAVLYNGASGTIGGLTPADRNLLGGTVNQINNENGILVFNSSSVLVVGNLIGMNKAGTGALAFGEAGIKIAQGDVTIGGSTAAHRNVISGMSSPVDGGVAGIAVATCPGCVAGNVVIQGNFIGTTADGSAALPNFHGIFLGPAASMLIGGTNPGEGNLIRSNLGRGIQAFQDSSSKGFRILGNSIHGNGSLGIDLLGGPNIPNDVNDALDADLARQNYPVITNVALAGGAATISGTLNSTASRQFRLEFFANNAADASSFGEGQTFLGAIDVTTDASGNATFTTPALGAGLTASQFITATATDSVTNDTSEFSQLTADVGVTITDTPDPAAPNADVTYTMTVTNAASAVFPSGPVTLTLPLPAGAQFQASTGNVAPVSGTVTFPLGTLAIGQSVQRQIVVRYATVGARTATATVSSTVSDPTATNNSAAATTQVAVPVTFSISGTVRTGINTALPGVTLTLTGTGGTRTTTSASNGTYSFGNLQPGSYVITPSVAGRAFEPESRTLNDITTSQANQDFVGRFVRTITGQVRDLNDTGVPGVTMTLSGDQSATTTTDLNGNYQFTGIVNGRTVTVTPSKSTFAFDPPSQTFPNISRDEVAGFFVAQVGTFTRYFAEGATGPFFDTQIALLNATGLPATATLKFQKADGTEVTQQVAMAGLDRKTVFPETIAGLEDTPISTEITSDQPIIADRTMTWDANRYGSHAETSIGRPLTRWFLAEGATISGFDLFYLIQNPNPTTANVQVRYLLTSGAPLTRSYQVPARSRFNIWVNLENPVLAAAEVSADITSDLPVIVERAMYRSIAGQTFTAGHEGAGVEAPALQWFFAEGATGPFFDLFFLVANPNDQPATIDATYLKPDGSVVTRQYAAAANSRFNIWVDFEDPALASTPLGATFRVTNGVPVVIERAMWWPGQVNEWVEGHNTVGATATGEKWGLGEGEVGVAPFFTDTYILVANTSNTAGTVRVRLIFDDGTAPVSRDFPIAASSRLNVAASADFPEAIGKRFGAVVESVGTTPVQLVVERAMYNTSSGVSFSAGTAALGTLLRPGGNGGTAAGVVAPR